LSPCAQVAGLKRRRTDCETETTDDGRRTTDSFSQVWGKGFLLYPFTDACADDGRRSGTAAVVIFFGGVNF
jgi:hypothetical protein